MLVPLPPLAEQQRIVARVDELMILCDSLKEHLAKYNTLHEHLATALVEKAVSDD
jgi:type I restriction enzyme S subunit